ncbi:MAG: acyl carrier protein [Solirubrobacteraceae bacterium]
MRDEIRQLITEHAHLSTDVHALSDDQDLYDAGMSSHASVALMLALEDHFDVEFPDSMLKRSTFETVSSILAAVDSIKTQALP